MMKALYPTLLLLLLACGAAAQAPASSPPAPGVKVLKNNWRREVRNPAMDEDPLRVAQDQAELERSRKETIQENVDRVKAKQEPLPIPTSGPRRETPGRPTAGYVYEATVSNTGVKTITKLTWEYVLIDPQTQRTVGHHRFTSEVNIRPGKSAKLVGHSKFPPASIVDATKAGEDTPGQNSEQVVIYRIEYKNGPAWERQPD